MLSLLRNLLPKQKSEGEVWQKSKIHLAVFILKEKKPKKLTLLFYLDLLDTTEQDLRHKNSVTIISKLSRKLLIIHLQYTW